jgi:hypothetical protein
MRLTSLPTLAAVLSLRASGVLSSSVICEQRGVDNAAEGAGFEDAKLCIEDFCATKGTDEAQITKDCGSILLTVTHLQAPSSSGAEDCVSQFNSIINQCVIPEDSEKVCDCASSSHRRSFADTIQPATSQTEATLYEISLTDEDESELESRGLFGKKPKGGKKPDDKKPDDKKPDHKKPDHKKPDHKKPDDKKPDDKHTPKPTPTPTPTPSKSASKKSSSTLKTKASSSSATPSASACPIPDKNGKGGKGGKGKGLQRRCEDDKFYAKKDLLAGKVTHWKFNKFEDSKNYKGDASAKAVLDEIVLKGQLDVVKVATGDILVTGTVGRDPDDEVDIIHKDGTDPKKFAKDGGNYLLINGGFFQHLFIRPKPYWPVGATKIEAGGKLVDLSVTADDWNQNAIPIMKEYAPYYQKIEGIKGTFVHSGPQLKTAIPEVNSASGVFKYVGDQMEKGALDHASQANERIALVTFASTRYVFAYTCETRECGVHTNKLRDIIDKFFTKMESGKSLSSSTQAVCLDGGPSIYMSWNHGKTEDKIAMGGNGDLTPPSTAHGRNMGTVLKIMAK